jgi:hypothetical protein
MDLRATERTLVPLGASDLRRELDKWGDVDLIPLLDAKSIRVGNEAASILAVRKSTDAVVNAILESHIRTRLGRVRATNILHRWGARVPRAVEAYLRLLADNSRDVIGNALFGLVFLRATHHLATIRSAKEQPSAASARDLFDKAIVALEQGDPSLYSPYFRDTPGVWKLDEQ